MAIANPPKQETQHSLLVVLGQFVREIGLIAGIEGMKLDQKTYEYSPQTKVLEFLEGILFEAMYLQDISLEAHPLDKDLPWRKSEDKVVGLTTATRAKFERSELGRSACIGCSFGTSRTVLYRSRIEAVAQTGTNCTGRFGLTGIPVSTISFTYPNVAFVHMDDEIRLVYQAGVTSLHSRT